MKTTPIKTASGMYINYFFLGMVNIILASNMSSLTKQWNTDPTGDQLCHCRYRVRQASDIRHFRGFIR